MNAETITMKLMNVEDVEAIAEEFSEHLFASLREFYDKTGLKDVPVVVILNGLIEAAGRTLCAMPEDERAAVTLAFIQDVLDEVEAIDTEKKQQEAFLEELRDRLSLHPER